MLNHTSQTQTCCCTENLTECLVFCYASGAAPLKKGRPTCDQGQNAWEGVCGEGLVCFGVGNARVHQLCQGALGKLFDIVLQVHLVEAVNAAM